MCRSGVLVAFATQTPSTPIGIKGLERATAETITGKGLSTNFTSTSRQ